MEIKWFILYFISSRKTLIITLKNSGNSQFLSADLRKQGRKIAEMRKCIPPGDPPPQVLISEILSWGMSLSISLMRKSVGDFFRTKGLSQIFGGFSFKMIAARTVQDFLRMQCSSLKNARSRGWRFNYQGALAVHPTH